MADITGDFNINMPSGTSRKSDGDDLMRQHWRSLGSAWSTEHYFTDSATSAGIHKKGSARAYVDTTYPVSSLDRDGKIFFDSALSRTFVLRGSTVTNLIGGAPNEQAIHLSAISRITPAVVAQAVTISYSTTLISATLNEFTFPIIFDDPPVIVGTVQRANATDQPFIFLETVSVSDFSFIVFDHNADANDASDHTVNFIITGHVSNMS